MSTVSKRIIISLLALAMFGLLIWSSMQVARHSSSENEPSTTSNYINFSKNVTSELQKKQSLSSEGRTVKQELLAPLEEEAGVLFNGPNFKIEYFPALTNLSERFVVELKSTDFEVLKGLARQWFLDKGFSQSDVCNLPIAFYPSSEVISNYPPGESPEINPVLENCNEE